MRSAISEGLDAYTKASPEEKARHRATLTELYQFLHDIRHYPAVGDLGDRWKWKSPRLRVLYAASGSHLAPLELVHRGRLREAELIYTEIDPGVIPRIDALLRLMVSHGWYQGLRVQFSSFPGTVRPGLPAAPAPDSGEDAFFRWLEAYGRKAGGAPPFSAEFSFRYRETAVRLKVLISAPPSGTGSTSTYRGDDLRLADLVMTHDFSFDPRENLALLRAFLESACEQGRQRPLSVMMEDLRRHPYPIDLGPFCIRAESPLPYGHAAFVRLPGGERLESEDGAPLYEGGVIVEPDIAVWRALEPAARTALFNLLLLETQGLDRRNVDLVDGRRIAAPDLLDLHAGYGLRDIAGRDMRDQGPFLETLADQALRIHDTLPAGPLRQWLCAAIGRFRSTLQREAGLDVEQALQKALQVDTRHPFLLAEASRRELGDAIRDSGRARSALQWGRNSARAALGRLRAVPCASSESAPAQ